MWVMRDPTASLFRSASSPTSQRMTRNRASRSPLPPSLTAGRISALKNNRLLNSTSIIVFVPYSLHNYELVLNEKQATDRAIKVQIP